MKCNTLQIVEALTPQFSTRFHLPANLGVGDSQIKLTDKNHALAEYALAGLDNNLFVSKYLLELPKKEEMQRFIDEQLRQVQP